MLGIFLQSATMQSMEKHGRYCDNPVPAYQQDSVYLDSENRYRI